MPRMLRQPFINIRMRGTRANFASTPSRTQEVGIRTAQDIPELGDFTPDARTAG